MAHLCIAFLAALAGAPQKPSAAVADPLSPYRGHAVLSVDIDAPPSDDVAELLSLVNIEPGFLLSSDSLQAAVKRIYALGRYASVEVYAERLRGVVALHFYLRPIKRLAYIEIAGLKHTDEQNLRAALRLDPEDEVDSRTPGRLEKAALGYLARAGFERAELSVVPLVGNDATLVAFRLRIAEGVPTRVTSLHIDGRLRVPESLLRKIISTGPGSIVDVERLERDRQRLVDAYVNRGFLKASVQPAQVEVSGDFGASVRFKIDAGPRIAVDFVGNRAITDDDLWDLWPGQSRRLRRGDLMAFRQRIERHYRKQGYAFASVQLRGFWDAARRIVRYIYQIEEDHRIRVASLRFEGVSALPSELLEDQVQKRLLASLDDPSLIDKLRSSDILSVWRDPEPRPLPSTARQQVPPGDRWVPELYQEAINDITAMFRFLGFLEAKLGTPQFRREGDDVHVTIPIEQGVQTSIRSIGFSGNRTHSSSELMTVISGATAASQNFLEQSGGIAMVPGAPVSPMMVEEARIALIKFYRDQGYLYARVFSDVDRDKDGHWADVKFRFEEGPQVQVGRVLVRGNHHTRRSIIGRRISLKAGDVYKLDQAIEDQRSIASLGVFSQVRVKLIDEERPAEVKDLVAEVTERSRQSVEVAPGISTADGPRLRASYSHINVLGSASTFTGSLKLNRQMFFSLLGEYAPLMRPRFDGLGPRDQILKAVEREVRAGIRSPPLHGLPLRPTLRLDLLNEREVTIPYSLDEASAIAGVDLTLSEHLTMSFEPQMSLASLECPNEGSDKIGSCQQEQAIGRRIEEGTRWMMRIGPEITLDLRDSPLSPRSGIFANIKAIYATGQSRGSSQTGFEDFAFTKVEGNLTGYLPLRHIAVLAISARAGLIALHSPIGAPIDERFYLGGRSSLRGYVEGTVIPQDACVVPQIEGTDVVIPSGCVDSIVVDLADTNPNDPEAGDELPPPVSRGGNTYLLLKTELRFPLGRGFFLDLFADVGNLWASTPNAQDLLRLRLGTGAGLRYATPVGALVLDFGVNPQPRSYPYGNTALSYTEPRWQFHFSVGAF